jgi:hypothetical protein
MFVRYLSVYSLSFMLDSSSVVVIIDLNELLVVHDAFRQ